MTDFLGPLNLILLAVPGLALHLALRVVYGPARRHESELMRLILSLTGTLLIAAALIGAIVAISGPVAIPLGILGFVAALMIVDRQRRAEHRALLWSLAVAAERGILLSEAARAYADESRGDVGMRATQLALALENGVPLGQAVQHARLRLAAPMRLAVQLGESLDVLGPAMRQQLDDSQQADTTLRDTIGRFVYLVVVLLIMQGILAFVMLKIVPVFFRMFEEFGLKLPAMTQAVVDFSNWFVSQGWMITALVIAIPLLVLGIIIVRSAYLSFREYSQQGFRRAVTRWTAAAVVAVLLMVSMCGLVLLSMAVLSPLPALLLGVGLFYIGWFPRDLPIIWRWFLRYDGAVMLRGLALAVRRHVPLPQAMDLVAAHYPLRYPSRALASASERVKQGQAWTECLRQAGLIGQAEVAVLNSAQRAGNLPWALEEMADSALRRMNYRLHVGLQMLFPPAMLILGGFIGFIVIGLFLPLVALIQGLT